MIRKIIGIILITPVVIMFLFLIAAVIVITWNDTEHNGKVAIIMAIMVLLGLFGAYMLRNTKT